MRSIAIIPTYNERENLSLLVPEVLAVSPTLDVLIVDDGSPDGTGELAERLGRETSRVRVLHRSGKRGLGTAYVEGFRAALESGYERVVQMDADLSHRPEDLPRLLRASEEADVVIGSRGVSGGRVQDWSALRRLVSRGGSLYARALLGLPIKDVTGGFKCFWREALEVIPFEEVESGGYGFQVEVNYLCHRAGLRIVEVPIVFPDRVAGDSKMSWPIFLEAAALVWRLRRRKKLLYPRYAAGAWAGAREHTEPDSPAQEDRRGAKRRPLSDPL